MTLNLDRFPFWFGRTVRWRLTFWYTLVLFLSFLVSGAIADHLLMKSLLAQTDQELLDALSMVAGAIDRLKSEGIQPTPDSTEEEINEVGLPSRIILQIIFTDGSVLHFNTRSLPKELTASDVNRSDSPDTIHVGSREWRVCRGERGGFTILLMLDLAPIDAQVQVLRRNLLIALPLILLFAAGSGYFLAGRALRPVIQIATQARHIEAHALEQRLEVASPHDEFGQLAKVLNDLFSRLENAFRQQRQFLSDAAHELRTPAAILLSQADVALEKPRTADENADTLRAMRVETERLGTLVDDLLLMARAEASQLPLEREPVDLVETIDESCREMRPLAQRKNLELRWTVGEEVNVGGDARLLRRAVVNLLANAIRYTPAGGVISIAVRCAGNIVSVEVRDTGMGVPEKDLPRIFDRFYRGKAGPASFQEGAGLGLAIVRMIAELHGGGITAHSRPGEGSTFTLTLPCLDS
jgi:heavy metal sensor kinase